MKKPTIKQLKDAITKLENSDLFYKHAGGFQGVDVYNIKLEDKDDMEDSTDLPSRKVLYSADVCYDDRKETYWDCFVTLKEISSFLPKQLS